MIECASQASSTSPPPFPPPPLGSLGVRPATGNITQFQNCYFALNPSNTDYPPFLNLWEQVFKCRLDIDYIGNPRPDLIASLLPVCASNVRNRTWPINCSCSGEENLNQSFVDVSLGHSHGQDGTWKGRGHATLLIQFSLSLSLSFRDRQKSAMLRMPHYAFSLHWIVSCIIAALLTTKTIAMLPPLPAMI